MTEPVGESGDYRRWVARRRRDRELFEQVKRELLNELADTEHRFGCSYKERPGNEP